ncbi:MAG: FAD-dependent oxidoreductase [Peptococcaceae bacterium]|nr:FAD-dependent oxidoreductase [Peptococcaceae bacterium]
MKNLEADVVVVAAGLSGLAAAIAAAEGGVSVIAFEKGNTTGGAANMGMGPLGIGTRHQQKQQVHITPGEAFRKHMHWTHWRVDPRLVRDYYFKSGSTIEWLEEMGVEFMGVARVYPAPERIKAYAMAEETWHLVKPEGTPYIGPRMAATMIKRMTERARELGVQILLETPVKKILKENGRIVGVIAEDKNGESIRANAKAVIIATGGCGDNPEMIKQHTGFEWGKDLFSFRIPGLTGDGIRMAWEVGAGKEAITMDLMYQIPDNLNHFIIDGAFRQPCLWVNALGERFMNEDGITNTTFVGNVIAVQPKRYVYSVFDEALLQHYKKDGPDIQSHVHPHDLYDHFEDAVKSALDEGYEHVFVADSIEELAGKIGIDPAALKNTIEEYNKACEKNYDELFEKDRLYLQPIKQPKFYACRQFPGAYGTLGGIKINYKTEVVTDDHEVIPGLYAVGLDACSIYGDSYPFILGGNTMGFCLNSGRIAGENAVKYINSI